jgi:hypothetical protein
MKGQYKPNSGHYYTAHLCPNKSIVKESNHSDHDFLTLPIDTPSLEDYHTNLIRVINSATQTEFNKNSSPFHQYWRLWHELLPCETTDDKSSWHWVTLVGDIWSEHGKLIATTTKYFPLSFRHPP